MQQDQPPSAVLSMNLFEFSKIEQVYCLLVSFLIHEVTSIFIKQKAYCMLGAIVATITFLNSYLKYVLYYY